MRRKTFRSLLCAGLLCAAFAGVPASAHAASCTGYAAKLALGYWTPAKCTVSYKCNAAYCDVYPRVSVTAFFLNSQGGSYGGVMRWAARYSTAHAPAVGAAQQCTASGGGYAAACSSDPGGGYTFPRGATLTGVCYAPTLLIPVKNVAGIVTCSF